MLHAAPALAAGEVTSSAPAALCMLKPVQQQPQKPRSFSSKVLPHAWASPWSAAGKRAHWGGDAAHAAAVRLREDTGTSHHCREEASPPAAATFSSWASTAWRWASQYHFLVPPCCSTARLGAGPASSWQHSGPYSLILI